MAENRNAQQVREITDKLEQGLKELFESERFKEYLKTMSKFYNYSFNNTLLIAMQKPDATLIAGYTAWQRNFDRHVMKGEKGIKILAPAPYKVQEEREKLDPATQKPVLDKDGKPSIDMNGYKGSDSLVSQDLIKGNGAEVKDTQTVVANYTGWLLNGTQFDSSWDRGESSSFSLDSVIKGWKQGLAGHTVGSQVLLVVPPDLGYGNKKQSSIPANSTLVFVVDILAAY